MSGLKLLLQEEFFHIICSSLFIHFTFQDCSYYIVDIHGNLTYNHICIFFGKTSNIKLQ